MTTRCDLVEEARAGDDEAFMGLVAIETPDAFRLSLAILRRPDDAEDALQDAFVRAWRDLPRLRDPDRWTPWFRRIVVSSAIDMGRREKAHRVMPLGLFEPPPTADGSAAVCERDEVLQALNHLDVGERALLVLRFGRDLPLPEIADVLGIPLGTAKSRLHRVLARLRGELENVDGHRGDPSREAEPELNTIRTEPGI